MKRLGWIRTLRLQKLMLLVISINVLVFILIYFADDGVIYTLPPRKWIGSVYVRWLGCNRYTSRCGDYLHHARRGLDTPQCCITKLEEVARKEFERLESVNATYWIAAGTLLGSLRHGTVIPWDTDVDIGVLVTDDDEINALFKVHPMHGTEIDGGYWATFFSLRYSATNRNRAEHLVFGVEPEGPWEDDERRIMSRLPASTDFGRVFLRWSDVFPLRRCLFAGVEVPCPNKPLTVLRKDFKLTRSLVDLQGGMASMLVPFYHKCEPHGCPQRSMEQDTKTILDGIRYVHELGYPSLRDLLRAHLRAVKAAESNTTLRIREA